MNLSLKCSERSVTNSKTKYDIHKTESLGQSSLINNLLFIFCRHGQPLNVIEDIQGFFGGLLVRSRRGYIGFLGKNPRTERGYEFLPRKRRRVQ